MKKQHYNQGVCLDFEVIIAGIEPKVVGFSVDPWGTMVTDDTFELETYCLNQPLTHRAEFLAIRGRFSNKILRIVKIDKSKSDYTKGLIVPDGKPFKAFIDLKVETDGILDGRIWYTSFRTLMTHNSVNDFTEESVKPAKKVLLEDRKIRCNGSECNHITYCKYFNHSETNPYLSTL